MFKGIEGARGYLAWTVVLSHIVVFSGIPSKIGQARYFGPAGTLAVSVFIIISGFVITNLILSKNENYRVYISRRFLRIYPAYIVALALGILVSPLSVDALSDYTPLPARVREIFVTRDWEYSNHFPLHLFAHLFLMHGAIPNNVLNESQFMLLGPAWSLSLEWQFYLIAPAAVALMKRSPIAIVVATAALLFLYERHIFGTFRSPSFLPGAGHLFLLGMATRIFAERLPKFPRFPWVIFVASLMLVTYSRELWAIVIWIGIVCYFQQPAQWPALDSKIAVGFGKTSYAVYIVHQPLMYLCAWIAIVKLGLSFWSTAMFIAVGTVTSTGLCAVAIYFLIERPFINLGRRVFSRSDEGIKRARAPG